MDYETLQDQIKVIAHIANAVSWLSFRTSKQLFSRTPPSWPRLVAINGEYFVAAGVAAYPIARLSYSANLLPVAQHSFPFSIADVRVVFSLPSDTGRVNNRHGTLALPNLHTLPSSSRPQSITP